MKIAVIRRRCKTWDAAIAAALRRTPVWGKQTVMKDRKTGEWLVGR